MSDKTNLGKTVNRRKSQLDAVMIRLGNQKPSERWRGIEQIRQWLKENPEDKGVYGVLLDAVKENRELREQARNLLDEMMRKGSKSAEQAMLALPSSVQDLLADADDVYYSGDYEHSINLYRQVLRLDSENTRAKDHIAKAELKRMTEESDSDLPRAAEHYYRKARSYLAARDVAIAMSLFNASIEAAQAAGKRYPDAEEALNNMQNLLTADEYRQKAKVAIIENKLNEALSLYNQGLTLDSANHLMKKELDTLQDVLSAYAALKQRGILKIFMLTNQLQNTVDTARLFMDSDTPLLSFIERQLNQIRLFRTMGAILLLVIIIFPFYRNGNSKWFFTLVPTNTPAIIFTATDTPEAISTNIEQQGTAPLIATNTQQMDTKTPQPTPSETLTPTPTDAILNVGYINKGAVSAWNAPNGEFIEQLKLNHPISILEKKYVTGSNWYRCKWESDGTRRDGWIIAEYITIGPPPP